MSTLRDEFHVYDALNDKQRPLELKYKYCYWHKQIYSGKKALYLVHTLDDKFKIMRELAVNGVQVGKELESFDAAATLYKLLM